jgi:hypothetical protein
MVYRISLFTNPKIFLVFLIIFVLPAAAVLSFFIFNTLIGIVAVGVSLYINYHLIKFIIGHLTSRVETGVRGITCKTPMNETIEFSWDKISHAGSFGSPKSKPGLFIYNEENDRLVKIPRDYGSFDTLVKELKGRTAFLEIELSEGESLEDRLRQIVE